MAQDVSSPRWRIRAVQLDLARQMETPDFIRRFADSAAAQGFNTLVLYLEGRVRTRTFPHLPREQSYSLEDMAGVIEHARGAGLECMLATATLAHCEHFLGCQPLAHLAEERDGRTRFGTTRLETFCPSLPETYAFLRQYLAELTQVFTCKDLHVGCDESFNLGFCKLCAERWPHEGLGGIFTAHIHKLHEICRGLGKRMWIWDDMYELFPAELERAPRDIVLCHWNYDPLIEPEGAKAHFANRWRQDWLAHYQRLGFESVFCPAVDSARNVETFTAYARRHHALGALLTQWEMQGIGHEEFAPNVAFTGQLWKQPDAANPERAWEDGLQQVLPGLSAPLACAVRTLSGFVRKNPPPFEKYLPGPLSENEQHQRAALQAGLALLRVARAQSDPARGREILDELDFSARLKLLYFELQALLPAIFDPRRAECDLPVATARAQACREELDALIANRAPIHERRRPGMYPANGAVDALKQLRTALQTAWQRLERPARPDDWWLVLRLCLTDLHGAPRLSVSTICGAEVQALVTGCIKPVDLGAGHYTARVPFTATTRPDAVRLEVWGYGGLGVSYLEAQSSSATLRPSRLRAASGLIERPEALLRDDSSFACLGDPDYRAAMLDPARAEKRAAVEIALAT